MIKFIRFCTGIFIFVLSVSVSYPQVIPFDSDRWEIVARQSKVEDYMGRKSLLLRGGIASIKDSYFTNGVIEFDVSFSRERGFMGGVWRLQDLRNYEEFYMRPHQSGNPDANQYTPIFNGLPGWQLYYGEGYGAPVVYPFNEWIHVKIIVFWKKAEIYINNMDKPVLFVSEMKRDIKPGRVGVKVNSYAPAHFSNFSFKKIDTLSLKEKTSKPAIISKGTIISWLVSVTFNEKSLDGKFKLTKEDKEKLSWKRLDCETSGLANLAKIQGIDRINNTVFAKVTVVSEMDQVKKLKFGFSDRIKVYFNDQLIYGGNNFYRSRDYRFLGTIGYFDELYLSLEKGENELWMAVSESFGGWGIKAMFEDTMGIEIKLD